MADPYVPWFPKFLQPAATAFYDYLNRDSAGLYKDLNYLGNVFTPQGVEYTGKYARPDPSTLTPKVARPVMPSAQTYIYAQPNLYGVGMSQLRNGYGTPSPTPAPSQTAPNLYYPNASAIGQGIMAGASGMIGNWMNRIQGTAGNNAAPTGGTGGTRQGNSIDYAKQRIDSALGQGAFERLGGTNLLQKFQDNEHHYYWDEPKTLDGAINSAIRDEMNNARNAARWQELHGGTKITQEQWDRWYYANREGLGPNDLMSDGKPVVY